MHADEREWIESATGAISIHRVLVAHDFSRYSQLALQYALNLVQLYQAELHLLHVLPPPIVDGPEIAWVGDKTNTPIIRLRAVYSKRFPEKCICGPM